MIIEKGKRYRVVSDDLEFFTPGEIVVSLEDSTVPYCVRENVFKDGAFSCYEYSENEYSPLIDCELEETENYIKAKYLKNDIPTGISYTYRSDEILSIGDKVETADGKHLIVVDEPVDTEWVEIYGADKIGVVKKVEVETFDLVKANEAQENYCKENSYPHFAPISRCYKCSQNIYGKEGKARNGKMISGISVEKAGSELITGCPFCNWSYCD